MTETPIKGLDENLRPPTERIADATSARSLLSSLLSDDQIASERRAKIQGMIDGNPPFSDEQLKKMGRVDSINVNWGHAEEKVETACLPYYGLLTNVAQYATVNCYYGSDASQREEWGRIMSEEFHNLLSSDDSFLLQQQAKHRNIVIHGLGCLIPRDALDWRVKSIDPWNVIAPRDATIDWLNWEFCFILDTLYSEELYRAAIANPEIGKKNGWDLESCKQAIKDATPDTKDEKRPWEWYQNELRTNSLLQSRVRSNAITVAHMYVKEFDGRISHYIFDRRGSSNWLRKAVGVYESFKEAFLLFISGVGNNRYHGVRGLGQKVFKYAAAINQVNNSVLEGAILSSSLMLQPATGSDVTKLQTISFGPFKVLPPGLSVAPVNLNTNLNGAIAVAGYFQNQEIGQIASHIPTSPVSASTANKLTKEEYAGISGENASLSNTRAELYMRSLDIFYAETFRRAANPNLIEEDNGGRAALEFQANCVARGVPPAAMQRVRVTATRSIGQGSSAAQKMTMGALLEILPTLPEDKRINVVRDYIASLGGQQFVNKYGPTEMNRPIGADASIAALENNAFMGAGNVLLDPTQNHFTHATVHLEFLISIAQAVQQQAMSFGQADQILQTGGPHLMAHLQYLASDPTRKAQYTGLQQQTAELLKLADQIASLAQEEAQQQQEQQAQAQEQGGEVDPKVMAVQGKLELQRAKLEGDMQLKSAKLQHQLALNDKKVAQQLRLKQIQAENK